METSTVFTALFVTEMSAAATWADMTWNGMSAKELHQANVKAAKLQSTLSFQPVSSALTKKVIHAEVKVATLLVHCNIPLALADELTPLFRDVFSDSQIAKTCTS